MEKQRTNIKRIWGLWNFDNLIKKQQDVRANSGPSFRERILENRGVTCTSFVPNMQKHIYLAKETSIISYL